MSKQFLIIMALYILTANALAQEVKVRGLVIDPYGAVIPHAYVLFRTDALDREHDNPNRVELRTNKASLKLPCPPVSTIFYRS